MPDLRAAARHYFATADRLRRDVQVALVAVALKGEAEAKENATARPRVRAGMLRRSIKGRARETTKGVEVILQAGGGPAGRYAAIQEHGGVVRPTRGRYLAMPIGPALTSSGVARHRSPRDVDGLRFVPIRGGSMGLLVRDAGDRSDIWYILLRRVRVPATRFLGRAIHTIGPDAEAVCRRALRDGGEVPGG